jgi:hypothetical protein
MTKLALALLLLSSNLAFAAKPKANPADYNVTVQVVFSRYILADNPIAGGHQQLETLIGGQQVELQGATGLGVLTPGDYKAMSITTENALGTEHGYIPKHLDGFDNFIIYRFLLPDGSTRDYYVIGLGPKTPYGATPPSPANP